MTEEINWKAEYEAVCSERIKDRQRSQEIINERDAWILDLLSQLASSGGTATTEGDNSSEGASCGVAPQELPETLPKHVPLAAMQAVRRAAKAGRKLNTELLAVLHEGRRAIGDHWAPNDCYATGPVTGDPFRDLIQCPACAFIAAYDAVVAKTTTASAVGTEANGRSEPNPTGESTQ